MADASSGGGLPPSFGSLDGQSFGSIGSDAYDLGCDDPLPKRARPEMPPADVAAAAAAAAAAPTRTLRIVAACGAHIEWPEDLIRYSSTLRDFSADYPDQIFPHAAGCTARALEDAKMAAQRRAQQYELGSMLTTLSLDEFGALLGAANLLGLEEVLQSCFTHMHGRMQGKNTAELLEEFTFSDDLSPDQKQTVSREELFTEPVGVEPPQILLATRGPSLGAVLSVGEDGIDLFLDQIDLRTLWALKGCSSLWLQRARGALCRWRHAMQHVGLATIGHAAAGAEQFILLRRLSKGAIHSEIVGALLSRLPETRRFEAGLVRWWAGARIVLDPVAAEVIRIRDNHCGKSPHGKVMERDVRALCMDALGKLSTSSGQYSRLVDVAATLGDTEEKVRAAATDVLLRDCDLSTISDDAFKGIWDQVIVQRTYLGSEPLLGTADSPAPRQSLLNHFQRHMDGIRRRAQGGHQ